MAGFLDSGSDDYWGATAWDPDDCVYVGKGTGQCNFEEDSKPNVAWQRSGCVGLPRGNSDNFWEAQDCSTANASLPIAKAEVTVQTRTERSTSHVDEGHHYMARDIACPTPVAQKSTTMPRGDMPRGDSGHFWDDMTGKSGDIVEAWGQRQVSAAASSSASPGRRNAFGQRPSGSSSGSEAPEAELEEEGTQFKATNVSSAAYWIADQWDPDCRVYVGADIGQTNHLTAVDIDAAHFAGAGAKLTRAWAGGLVSRSLNLKFEVGPAMDLCSVLTDRPTLDDEYDILDAEVGTGSFGVVRRAVHRKSGTQCALKAVRSASAGDQYRTNLIDRGLGEQLLRMSLEIPHVNIARYHDMLEGPTHFYVVMEELSGPELLQCMEECFPATEALLQRLLRQVLEGMAHLHDKVGLCHRDIKLANYRFRGASVDSSVVLLDFGFACSLSHKWDRAVCGTMMFMAPEVVSATVEGAQLAAVDLWAVGVMLYVLLTGDSPLNEEDVLALKEAGRPRSSWEALDNALACKELQQASPEALGLLRDLLVVSPARRATAAQALAHRWFESDGMRRVLSVPKFKYSAQRSEVMSPGGTRGLASSSSSSSSGSSPPEAGRAAAARPSGPPMQDLQLV